MLNDQLSKDALACYKPPFKFSCGYIFDSKHNMFSDLGDLADAENRLARIRGWGKLQYKKNPEALQDKLGELFAQALNEFWGRNQ